MGLDTSAHPFDVNLLRERILPFVLEGAPIDDLIERSVQVGLASWRASSWGSAVHNYARDISAKQETILKPERDAWLAAYDAQKAKPSLLSRLFGFSPKEEDLPHYPLDVLLPGFDTDLHLWGRPFFIVSETHSEVAAMLDRYLSADGTDEVDAAAADCLAALEVKRTIRPDNVREELWQTIVSAPPLTSLTLAGSEAPPSIEELTAQTKAMVERWRLIIAETDLNKIAEIEGVDEEVTYGDLQRELPFDIVNFMAGLTPGWMSRGHGFASNLVDMVARKHIRLFETPAEPFAPLIKRLPHIKQDFHETIPENFSLGGYIPPDRVARFIDVLEEYSEPMIMAFEDRAREEITQEHYEMLQADWLKLREAAEYAVRHNMGYLEAAEVYSGPLGWIN